jgi:hypothetical protein
MSRRFFGLLCAHKWRVKAESPIIRSRNGECVGVCVMLQCEHCGDLKQRRTSVA